MPAERVETIDHLGLNNRVSGSSHAVPKVAALAARLLARNPDWGTDKLKSAIRELTGPTYERGGKKVK